jgi:hypothetical protein
MSDLQLALLLVAAVLLVLLYGYNKWQERRALQRLGDALRQGVGDALLQPAADAPPNERVHAQAPGARIEPSFGALAAAPGPPAPSPAEDVGAAATDELPAAAGAWIEDPMLDCVLEIRCAHPVDGVTVLDAVAGLQHQKFPLPVHVAAWDARAQQWVHPDRFGFYAELLAAIQMANRRVALDLVEASRFVTAVQQVALALDADVDTPDVERIVQLATELQGACARFDVQIGLTLESTAGPWDGARLAAAASAAGLEAAGPASWYRLDESGATLFTLGSASLLTDRLTLEFDVPLVPVQADSLRSMFDAATALAADLGARIVDDNGQPVDATSLAGVQARLDALYADMRHAGYEPASPRAVRLYA